jgi:hypothetical protein
MLKSFQALAAEPDSALKAQAANGRDVVQWLMQANTKLDDARQTAISPGTSSTMRSSSSRAWRHE